MDGISNSTHAEALLRDFPHTASGNVRIPEELLIKCNQLFQNYIFYETENKNNRRYICTQCYQQWVNHRIADPFYEYVYGTEAERDMAAYKHGETVVCPKCQSTVQLRNLGRSRSRRSLDQMEHMLFIWRASENLVYGVAAYVYKKLSEEYQSFQLDYSTDCLYAFEPGESHSWKKQGVWDDENRRYRQRYEECKTTAVPFAANIAHWCVKPVGLADAVENSFLKYCQYPKAIRHYNYSICNSYVGDSDYFEDDVYAGEHIVQWLSAYCKYPQIEMIAKLGLTKVIEETILTKHKWNDVYNWKAKSPQGFLKMTKTECKTALKHPQEIDRAKLKLYRTALSCGDNYEKMAHRLQCYSERAVNQLYDLSLKLCESPEKIISYAKASDMPRIQAYSYSDKEINDYHDYITLAIKCGFDMTQKAVKFPKSLHAAHERAVSAFNAIKIREESKVHKKLRRELDKRFGWENEQYIVRAPLCPQEIIAEGQALKHCVGGYAERHANGKTAIMFLRRKSDPETPYFTIELDPIGGTHIIQIHGFRNKNPIDDSKELVEFVEAYNKHLKDAKREKASQKKKTTVQKPAATAAAG